MNIEKAQFQKILFLTNAIENGWTVKKKGGSYIFSKKHEGRRQVFEKDYLETFIKKNLNCEEMISSINSLSDTKH